MCLAEEYLAHRESSNLYFILWAFTKWLALDLGHTTRYYMQTCMSGIYRVVSSPIWPLLPRNDGISDEDGDIVGANVGKLDLWVAHRRAHRERKYVAWECEDYTRFL
jgi:hypothetical protein